jgi:hypothetical protein
MPEYTATAVTEGQQQEHNWGGVHGQLLTGQMLTGHMLTGQLLTKEMKCRIFAHQIVLIF